MDSHEHDEQRRIEEPFEVEISDLGMSEHTESSKPFWLNRAFVERPRISRGQRRGLVGALGVLLLAVLVILLSLDTGLSSLGYRLILV
jgi:hypothetical protein